jgi:cytochrome P450
MDNRTPHPMGCLGLGVGLRTSLAYSERTGEGTSMDAIENIALMVVLMLAGAGATVAVLVGLIYFLEMQND